MGATRSLVLVPSAVGYLDNSVFDGTQVLVLDDLLMNGMAGVYFKRLRVAMVYQPGLRTEYERKRHAYLREVLKQVDVPLGVVVIGTCATDVDLFDFDSVSALRLSERGLRELSKKVYGDSVMLAIEYNGMLRVVDDAVDDWITVTVWHEVTVALIRKFPVRVDCVVTLSLSQQRAILGDMLVNEVDAAVWLEDVVHTRLGDKRTIFIADYDYLSFIRPVWRDAVVRCLGSAPSVVKVLRLPWFLVDKTTFNALCYRPNSSGVPSVSMRGESLIEFVKTRLCGVLTARELVGTWVGGLLSDDVTVLQSLNALGVGALAPVQGAFQVTEAISSSAILVPYEYAWMYTAVPGVVLHEWDGDVKIDGKPHVGRRDERWASTLPLAELYVDQVHDPRLMASIVLLFSRLHTAFVDEKFNYQVMAHAAAVVMGGLTDDLFDPVLTPCLPGYNYLFHFEQFERAEVVEIVGFHPTVAAVTKVLGRLHSLNYGFSENALIVDLCRDLIFAGKQLLLDTGQVVGADMSDPGYCYECLFKPEYRAKLRNQLGAYPAYGRVMHSRFSAMRLDDALDIVFVTYGSRVTGKGRSWVLHFSRDRDGVSLRQFMQLGVTRYKWLSTTRVGQNGTCYSAMWYVLAIIMTTAVAIFVLSVIVWLIYMRCTRGRSSSGRGGYRM